MPADQDASKCYDPTDDEYYHGYGCTIGKLLSSVFQFVE